MLLKMKNIVVNFGEVRAVKNVDFSVDSGEIHGLLGENGAGKSTLMNVLGGTFLPTSGEIYVEDVHEVIASPTQASKLKIRFIHQELNLCNDLAVFENIFLAEELKKGLFLDKDKMVQKTQEVLDRMESKISPTTLVSELEPAEKQLVEIAKALMFDSKLIIMDEPTTALGQSEINQLFKIMRNLKNEGVSFIYISHKMPEIFDICDRYTVLRDGTFISTGEISDINEKQITELMVGKELLETDLKEGESFIKDVSALELKSFSGPDFYNIDLEVKKGEIVAVTGLHGSGVGSLIDAIFGEISYESGCLSAFGKQISSKSSIKNTMKNKIAMVPRNRKERGIFTDLSICDNLSMASWNISSNPIISLKAQKEQYQKSKTELNIKADNPKNAITSLSGGNQQKVILGRWLETKADIFLLDNPTQGIDVGAKFEIYKLIIDLAKNGKTVLLCSNEFPEIWKVADRCIVLYKGEIAAELNRENMSEERIIYYSTGAHIEEGKHDKNN